MALSSTLSVRMRRPSAHWFRHTLNDLLRKATTGEVQRSITGHMTTDMSEHYSHVSISERQKAVDRALRIVTSAKAGDRAGDQTKENKKAG